MYRLFYATWKRHLKRHRLADYEVCRRLPCRLSWWLECLCRKTLGVV